MQACAWFNGPRVLMLFPFLWAGTAGMPAMEMLSTSGTVKVSLDAGGAYRVSDAASGWVFGGELPSHATGLGTGRGSDALGPYQELRFRYRDPAGPLKGGLRLYGAGDLVLFELTAPRGTSTAPLPFPDFRILPQGLYPFSFKPENFAPPVFALPEACTPWMLFDSADHALILSPASDFFNASMWGDGRTRLASGFNPGMARLPAGFTHRSLLALGTGINATWDAWGRAMTGLQGKRRPANDADRVLKTFGYWTDAGSAYWYNYDPLKGYAGTLQDVAASFKRQGIPLGYMQLDSWWYRKSLSDPAGATGKPSNPKLPDGDWNRYGGLMDYTADPFVFPQGLRAFARSIGLPVVNHNRWIDRASPYRKRFRISGIAALDPRFWEEIAAYLQGAGSVDYEQDWLSEIYKYSPDLGSKPGLGDSGMDAMAAAFKKRGMSLQYCMGLPLHFLEGSRYDNLTSIRASEDGFKPDRYHNFLYASRLASALGIWPWCDVFMSYETDNLILAVLSAGPVGTGDFVDQVDKANIMKAVRADGVIVKPDEPLLPTDASYLAEARGLDRPLVASTFTDHGGLRTVYGIAFRTSDKQPDTLALDPGEVGAADSVYFYDYLSGKGAALTPGRALPVAFHGGRLSVFVVAPLGASGMALLGDAGRLVGTGKKRIASVTANPRGITAEVLFSKGEGRLTLHGYAANPPKVSDGSGAPPPVTYDSASGLFSVDVTADRARPAVDSGGDPVRALSVVFSQP
jgi:hypothetical protein